ncbi:hypothetical protein MKW94_007752 [Papaver nudicaule]|uniref:Uncharacterized protein n=1 Tax=Papaver nudicaule TaxID=74823 RepID=A0AA41S4D8_PAPNU|nr:hypothetical protein [Papaver nudicaule]
MIVLLCFSNFAYLFSCQLLLIHQIHTYIVEFLCTLGLHTEMNIAAKRMIVFLFFLGPSCTRSLNGKSCLMFLCRYKGLDQLVRSRLRFQPNSLRFVASKIALDGGVFGPIYGISFFSYIGFASGKNLGEVKEGIKRDLIPSMAVGAAFGPIIQFLNFRYVPLMYQLLYVNMFCLLDSAFMSWIEQQEDAPWKKHFTSFLTFEDKQLEKKTIKEC